MPEELQVLYYRFKGVLQARPSNPWWRHVGRKKALTSKLTRFKPFLDAFALFPLKYDDETYPPFPKESKITYIKEANNAKT